MAAGTGLRRRRTALERAWAQWVPGLRTAGSLTAGSLPGDGGGVRREVAESWLRSLTTVDPGTDCAPTAAGEVHPRWRESPLNRPVSRLSGELHALAEDAGFVAAVTDDSGTILWTCGGRVMRQRAERMNFAPGGRWDEQAMGTNALSLALRTGRPATVFSAEHLVHALHGWVCYCAPIRRPDGRVLGVLDLSTTWDRSHPLALHTVRSLVTAIETELRAGGPVPAAPGGELRVACLGGSRVRRGEDELHLPPRQLEILTLLALEPGGFSADRLRLALYGDRPVSASTFKAEISRLRAALGGGVTARNYALTVPVRCDAVEVLRALEHGDAARAVRLYAGPLLPRSEAPGVLAWRECVEVAVREAVLGSTDPELALRHGAAVPHDTAVHEHCLRLLPPGDGRRAVAAGRLAAALRD
jgi:hypothetical protein